MADMRNVVDVVNGRGQVKFRHGALLSPGCRTGL
jgi:hypothetical protein